MKIEILSHEKPLEIEALEISDGVFQRSDGTVIVLGQNEAVAISQQEG